jgi:hypothetical protein
MILNARTAWDQAVSALTATPNELSTSQPLGDPYTGRTGTVNAVAFGQLDGGPSSPLAATMAR